MKCAFRNSVRLMSMALLACAFAVAKPTTAMAQTVEWCSVDSLYAIRGTAQQTNPAEFEVPAGATLRARGEIAWLQGNPVTVSLSYPFSSLGGVNPHDPPYKFSETWTNGSSSSFRASIFAYDTTGFLTGLWSVDAEFELSGPGVVCLEGRGQGDRTSDGKAGEPVSTSSGNLYSYEVDAEAPSGLGSLSRSYNSLDTGTDEIAGIGRASHFGRGWSSLLDTTTQRVNVPSEGPLLRMRLPDGRRYTAPGGVFSASELDWDPPPSLLLDRVYREESSSGSGSKQYHWLFTSGETWNFDSAGRLISVNDPHGPDLSIARASNPLSPCPGLPLMGHRRAATFRRRQELALTVKFQRKTMM